MRHYSPNIDSFLFSGEIKNENLGLDLATSVLIDFGGINSDLRDKVMHYMDLSEKYSTTEAIANIYESLRWAELRSDAKSVLITDLI